MARFFPDLRLLFGEDELYKIFNISVLATPWEGTKNMHYITEYFHSSLIVFRKADNNAVSILRAMQSVEQTRHRQTIHESIPAH